jgi:hypothetical protein
MPQTAMLYAAEPGSNRFRCFDLSRGNFAQKKIFATVFWTSEAVQKAREEYVPDLEQSNPGWRFQVRDCR